MKDEQAKNNENNVMNKRIREKKMNKNEGEKLLRKAKSLCRLYHLH
jgi:hypothetical protein